jgi:hypothetical protein
MQCRPPNGTDGSLKWVTYQGRVTSAEGCPDRADYRQGIESKHLVRLSVRPPYKASLLEVRDAETSSGHERSCGPLREPQERLAGPLKNRL